MNQQIQTTKSLNQTQPVDNTLHELKEIPLLDMKSESFSKNIVDTFKQIGFVILQNHGLQKERIDEAFTRARSFFALDKKTKKQMVFNPSTNRGYMGPGEEVLDEKDTKNQKKETLDLGHPRGPNQIEYYPKIDHFSEFFEGFYEDLYKINLQVLTAIEKGLELKPGYITKKCSKVLYNQTLRMLFYPELTLDEIKKQGIVRAGAHSDYGTLTLLIQKPGPGQSGLRALSAKKEWVRVDPPDYSIVVNLGDLFQHWANDNLVSTIHKVQVDDRILQLLENNHIDIAPERQTIVMFCDPDPSEIFQCLPHCGAAKYAPIDGKLYVLGRIKSTVEFKM